MNINRTATHFQLNPGQALLDPGLGLFYRYNEETGTFDLIDSNSLPAHFFGIASLEDRIAIVGRFNTGDGTLNIWDGTSMTSICGSVDNRYYSAMFNSTNDILLTGYHKIDPSHYYGIIDNYKNGNINAEETPPFTSDRWIIQDITKLNNKKDR